MGISKTSQGSTTKLHTASWFKTIVTKTSRQYTVRMHLLVQSIHWSPTCPVEKDVRQPLGSSSE
jgi:hypothetical protein